MEAKKTDSVSGSGYGVGMTIHGVCFDNGMAGKCGHECSEYLDGKCKSSYEVLKTLDTKEEIEDHIEMYPDDVVYGKEALSYWE